MFWFDYELEGAGWSRARVTDGASCALMTASYLSDALKNILDAVADVVEGTTEARCSWDEEPGEFRFLFRRRGSQMHLRICWFDELWGNQPDDAGVSVFETQGSVSELAVAICGAAERVLAQWGEDGYQEDWMAHPFPTASLGRLSTAIGSLGAAR